ncbi:hypothetical protein [Gemmatimonas aurantiaca]|uniref:hypothetical protein n=1 Tax=Gemmatimonas aurantiaca TaxID=173480 RepID=UPI0002EA7570|nr:hypothetical protein [Gemmatimonas aurantiaca]
MKKRQVDHNLEAEHAHADLNVCGAISSICERSNFTTKSGKRIAERINKLCWEEIHRQVRAMDLHREKAGRRYGRRPGAPEVGNG